MESLGEHLKSERELRGVTLEEIAHITRISTKFLHALENNDYQGLPSDVFVKGFLRAYAKCVGLDPNEIVSIYENIKTREEKKEVKEIENSTLNLFQGKVQSSKLILFVIVIALILTAAGVVVYYRFSSKTGTAPTVKKVIKSEPVDLKQPEENTLSIEGQIKGETSPPQTTPLSAQPVADEPPPFPSLTGIDIKKNEESPVLNQGEKSNFKSLEVSSSPELASGEIYLQNTQAHREPVETMHSRASAVPIEKKPLILTITAIETVWLQVVIDDSETKEAIMPSGEKLILKAKEKFSLTTGNIKGTDVIFNGIKVSLPSTRTNVLKNYLLKRDNG